MFKNWKVWLGFVISAVFLYFILKDVELNLLIESFRKAQWIWLLAGVPVWFVSLAARSQRWAVLMEGAPFWVAFHGTNIGYALNMTLPLRLGEVARAFAVTDRAKIPIAKVLSSIVVERLLDLAVVIGMFAVSAQFIEMPTQAQSYVRLAGLALVALIVIGAIVVWKARLFENILASILRRVLPRLNAEPWLQRFRELCAGFAVIGTPARFASVMGYTVLLWLGALAFAYLSMMAFMPARWDHAGLFLVGANLGGAIPSAPGALGVQEGAAIAIIAPFYSSEVVSTVLPAWAFTWSFSQRIALILLGIVGALSMGISFNKLTRSGQAVKAH
jgi:uncharacterized protein (TIRG00374 family)